MRRVFPNGGTGLFFGFGLAPFSAHKVDWVWVHSQLRATARCLRQILREFIWETYGTTYLIVLKIDFNTSGNNDTITAYFNPTANAAPGVAATYTVTTFDVGTITGVGFQNRRWLRYQSR